MFCFYIQLRKRHQLIASVLIFHRYQTYYSASPKKFLKSSSSGICCDFPVDLFRSAPQKPYKIVEIFPLISSL